MLNRHLFLNTSLILILLMPVVYLFFVFIGESIGWSTYSYDNWRVEQLMLMGVSFGIYAVAIHSHQKTLNHKVLPNKSLLAKVFILLICLGLIVASIYSATSSMLALMDLCLTLAVLLYLYVFYQCLSVIVQSHSFNNRNAFSIQLSRQCIDNSMAVIALLPVYISFWCVFGHYLYIKADVPLAWHGAFVNIRHYDDTLLPCLFLLWYRPGFLSSRPFIVLFCSSCYLFTLWIDAARAAWLSVLIGLLITVFFNVKQYKKLFIPFVSVILSLCMYLMLQVWLPKIVEYTVIRTTSSGRLDMWMAGIKLWSSNWLWGIGGANFVYYENVNHLKLGHIHNVILQFVIEWGLTGVVFLCFITYFYVKNIILKQKAMPLLLFCGVIGLSINMLLSGAHIYPQSQIVMVLYFAYALTFVLHINTDEGDLCVNALDTESKCKVDFFKIGILVASVVLIAFACIQYISVVELNNNFGPRVWQNGMAWFSQP